MVRAAEALFLAVQGDENERAGIGFPEFLHLLKHAREREERGDARGIAVGTGIEGSGKCADVIVMRGDNHVLVPASGQEAQDIVGGSAGDRPESVVPGAAGGKEAGGGELPGDARLRVDGARRAGGPAGEEAVGEKFHPRPEAVFGGDRLSVARADDIPLGLGRGESRQGQQEM
jgi:hypothetical protein